MRHVNPTFAIAFAAVAAPALAQTTPPPPQIVAHTVSFSRLDATLGLELADGNETRITLARGRLIINGQDLSPYLRGGPLEESWRALLDAAASLPTSTLRNRLAAWNVAGVGDPDARAMGLIREAFHGAPAAPGGGGDDVIRQTVREAVVEAQAEARSQAIRQAITQARPPRVAPASRGLGDVSNNVAGLLGMVVALACIAFGLVSFAPRQFEAVTDMVRRSFIRSFFTGLFAQPLLLPALGMMTVGLVLTIVGIIVVPVAIVAFLLAVALGVVGGYVALARAFGEILLRRRGGEGSFSAGTTPYKASVVGLIGLLSIWAPFALLSWVPLVNWILLWCAILFTWIMATAGFGATILSRGGLRQSFVRPELPGFSGEFSWTGEMEAHRAAMKELE